MRVASGFVDHFPMVAFASTKLPKRPSVLYVQITKNWQTRGKELAKRSSKLKQLTFLRVSRVLERCTANLKASNAWAEMWNKKVEEKAGIKMLNSKVRKEGACAERGGSFPSFRFHCPSIFKAGGPDSDKSKLV